MAGRASKSLWVIYPRQLPLLHPRKPEHPLQVQPGYGAFSAVLALPTMQAVGAWMLKAWFRSFLM